MSAPRPFYSKTPECLIILYDLRYLGTEERVEREQEVWYGSASVEELAEDVAALIIRPGGAARLAA